jgi:hypothetical protein
MTVRRASETDLSPNETLFLKLYKNPDGRRQVTQWTIVASAITTRIRLAIGQTTRAEFLDSICANVIATLVFR